MLRVLSPPRQVSDRGIARDGRAREEGGTERGGCRWRPSSGKELRRTLAALHRYPPVVSSSAHNCHPLHAQHGLYLAACGCLGAAQQDWAPKAMHSAYAGAGGGGVLVVCSLLSVSGSYRMYMIGVHVALLLQLLFIFVFALQVPPTDQRMPRLLVGIVPSIFTLSLCVRAGL